MRQFIRQACIASLIFSAGWAESPAVPKSVPEPIQTFIPYYPTSAYSEGTQGTVVVRFQVSASNGSPTKIHIVSGSEPFSSETLKSVKRWQFRGHGEMTLKFEFRLIEKNSKDSPSIRIIPWKRIIIEGFRLSPFLESHPMPAPDPPELPKSLNPKKFGHETSA